MRIRLLAVWATVNVCALNGMTAIDRVWYASCWFRKLKSLGIGGVMRQIPFLILVLAAVTGCTAADSVSAQQASPIEFPATLEARRVWSSSFPNSYFEAPSPDGRLITDIDWDTGDLAVIDLESGQRQRITDKGESDDYAHWSVFSPDGQRVAYTWFDESLQGYSVRTIALDGSNTRVLLPPREDIEYARVEDWSKDGRWILVTAVRSDRTSQIGILSVEDGTYHALKTNDWRSSLVAAFSPDRRYVAYDLANDEPDERGRKIFSIFLLSVDGSREIRLINGGRLLGWLPDGSGLLFASSTLEPAGFWALRIKDGEVAGPPELVRRLDSQVVPVGFSRDAYFYGMQAAVQQIYVAPIDLDRGHTLGPPQPFVADPSQLASGMPTWSPDGQSLAYLDLRSLRLIVRRVTGELHKEFPTGLSYPGQGRIRWMPDGGAVLLGGRDNVGRSGIHRLDLGDGTVRPVVIIGPHAPQLFVVSADGTLYYRQRLNTQDIIMARDLSRDQTKELVRLQGEGQDISVSPDGGWLALLQADKSPEFHIVLVPTSGGQPQELYGLPADATLGNRATLEWTPDGQSLLVFQHRPDEPGGVWRIPVSGEAPSLLIPSEYFAEGEELRQLSPSWRPYQMRLSPDGSRIAYRAGENRGEYWMLTGFPPAAEAASNR